MQANLLFLAVCDEEDVAECEAQPWLRGLQKENLEYLVCINTEPQWGVSGEGVTLFRNHQK